MTDILNPPTVIITSEFPPGPGGIGKHAYDLARALNYKNENVVVFATQDHALPDQIQAFNSESSGLFKIIKLERSGMMTYLNRWLLINKFLSNNNPKRIIVSGRFSLWIGYAIKIKFGNNITIDAIVHGSEFIYKNYFFKNLTIKALKKIDHLIAVSHYTCGIIKNIIPNKHVKIIPNGIWMDDFIKSNHNVSHPGEFKSLLTVGRLSPRKGQHRVIMALPEVIKTFLNLKYYMAGIPATKVELVKLAQQLSVENSISIYGKIESSEELYKIYQRHDIFIMLSETQQSGDTEGFGIAILEANYFGKPAIGAYGSGIEDAIKDGYNGILVDGNNPIQIKNAIENIYTNYEFYSANAVKWAEQHDWKLIIESYMSEPLNA